LLYLKSTFLNSMLPFIFSTTLFPNVSFSNTLSSITSNTLSALSSPSFNISVISFGFKYGPAADANLVFDVRCLPNPFYIEELRTHSGLDEDVKEYVMGHPTTQEFLKRWEEMLLFLIPHYKEEGKHRLGVAVGCTGGAHRSVAIAEAIGSFLRADGISVEVSHRDLQLEQARWTTPVEEA
jgi:UPF0042 nucleotide-binding protein